MATSSNIPIFIAKVVYAFYANLNDSVAIPKEKEFEKLYVRSQLCHCHAQARLFLSSRCFSRHIYCNRAPTRPIRSLCCNNFKASHFTLQESENTIIFFSFILFLFPFKALFKALFVGTMFTCFVCFSLFFSFGFLCQKGREIFGMSR